MTLKSSLSPFLPETPHVDKTEGLKEERPSPLPAETKPVERTAEKLRTERSIRRSGSPGIKAEPLERTTESPTTKEPLRQSAPPQVALNVKKEPGTTTPTASGRRPPEPGIYETIRTAIARSGPDQSAEVVDRIPKGTRLRVAGSEGDWLVVHSSRKNITAYVKRDDAMYISSEIPKVSSSGLPENRWRKIEEAIEQDLQSRGISGVSMSFIGDTVYLKGKVRTEEERISAELAAKALPEDKYVTNWLWVEP